MAEKKQVLRIDIKGNEELIRLRQSLQQYQKQLKDLRKEHKDSETLTKSQATEFANLELNVKKTRSEFNKASKSVKGLNDSTKKGIGFVGKMAGAFAAANIATAAFTKASGMLRDAIKQGLVTFKDFEFQMAKVKAISGASEREFQKLNNTAKGLGRTTFFTASQVGELQLNLSKLGFNTEEILQSQEAILNLSTAMGEDLGRTATVVAASIRGFGEDTDQTGRFADAMASAFANSALDIEKFQTSMTKVSAIAATAGFSFEETTGLLALLTDRGIEASIAGTSLRNILLKLQDPTSDLSERLGRTVHSGEDLIVALRELDASGIDVAGVMQIVDNRQVQAMESFIRSADAVEEFNTILNSSAGSAKDMATIMEGTVGGSFLRLKSAYEGFVLSLSTGTSTFSNVIQGVLNGISGSLNNLSSALGDSAAITDQIVASASTAAQLKVVDKDNEIENLSAALEIEKALIVAEIAIKTGEVRLAQGNIIRMEALKKEIKGRKEAIKEIDSLIFDAISKEMNAADEQAEQDRINKLNEAKNAQKLSEQIKALQEEKAILVDRGEKLNEFGKRDLIRINTEILALQDLQKELQNLGVEKKKSKEEPILDKTQAQGDNVSATEAVINQQRADLQKEFLDNKEMTEIEFNNRLAEIQVNALTTALEFETLTTEERIKLQDKLFKVKEQVANADRQATQDRIQQLTQTGRLLMEVGQAQGENNALTAAGIKITQLASVASGIDGLINAEVGIAQQAKLPFPSNIIAMAATAASVVSVIANLKALLGGSGGGGGGGASVSGGGEAITFANGGLTEGGMFKGASHANGGVKFAVGGRIHEAEGGEAIINKRSTAAFRPILSAINSYNGNGVKFAEGGLLSTGEKFAMGGELRSVQSMISGGGTQRVVLVESDVTSTQNRISALEARASF